MNSISAEYPPPRYRLAHLTDTHFTGEAGALLYGAADAESNLKQLLSELQGAGGALDAVIVSGDLTDKGEPAAYRRLRAMVEPVAERLGARILWAVGNHDDRAHLRSELLDEAPSDEPVYGTTWIDGLRILVLDTSVPGYHYGEIDAEQLRWLAAELESPAPDGTIVVMHHAPLPSVLELATSVELRGQREIAEVLRGSDVRSILSGHVHYSSSGTFAGIPVSTATSTAYTQDLNVETGGTRGRDGAQAFNLVYVYDDTVLHSVVPGGSHPTVGEFVNAEESQRRLARAKIVR